MPLRRKEATIVENYLGFAKKYISYIKDKFALKGLRVKLTFSVLVFILIAVIAMASFIVFAFSRYAEKKLRTQSLDSLKAVSYTISAAMEFDDNEMVEDYTSFLRNVKEILTITILKSDGSIFLQQDFNRDLPGTSTQKSIITLGTFIYNENRQKIGTLRADITTRYLTKELYESILNVTCIAIVTLISAFFCVIFIVGRFLKPVSSLKETIKQMSKNGFVGQVDVVSTDEVGELAVAFNELSMNLRNTMVSRNELAVEIEERKKAEEEITKFKVISDNANYSVFITDIHGHLLYINGFFADMHGCDADELIGKNISMFYSDSERKKIRTKYKQLLKTGSFSAYDIWHITGDGVRFPMLLSAVLIKNSRDEPLFIASTAIDITERRKMEEELRRSKEIAETANFTKSRFLANVSHEIRTPMNAIVGFVELLKNTPLTHQQIDYLDTIALSGNTLLDIISEVLDISKIESGELMMEYIDFNLLYLIEDVFKIIRPRLGKKPIDIQYHFSNDLPHNIKGDPTKLRQILMNLFSNAVKFTEQGEISLHVDVEQSFGEKKYLLRFTVSDTGIGIAPKKIQLIFEPFAQADTSTTRKYGGTGLGLAISKNFVELMGGTIRIESQPNKGSRFIFTIACEETDSVAEQTIYPIAQKDLEGKTVLIVDDNANNLHIMSSFCEYWKMIVHKMSSVEEAMCSLSRLQAAEQCPDIALVDIMMPDSDGFDFVQSVRKMKHFRDMKLVAVTSDMSISVTNQMQKIKFDAYMAKPILKSELLKILNLVLGNERKNGRIITSHMAGESSCKGLRVLVAEDNQTNQKLISLFLENFGCEIEIVNNGLEVLNKLEDNEYDIILMDIQMPVMSGYEATEEIRNVYKNDVSIIALTADAMKEDKDKCLAYGMNDYLSKPISAEKLKEKLLKWGRGYA